MEQGFFPASSVPAWVPELLVPGEDVPPDTSTDALLNGFELCRAETRRVEAMAARLIAQAFRRMGTASGGSAKVDAFVAELATMTRSPGRTASGYLDTALHLTDDLQATFAEFEAGRLAWGHAQVIAEGVEGLDPEQTQELERTALVTARTATVPQLKERVRVLRERLDVEGMERRHQEALRRRPGARMSPGRDGLVEIELTFGAIDGVAILNRLRAQAKELKGHEGETRSVGELQNDVARDLLLADLPVADADQEVADDEAPQLAETADGDVDAEPDAFDALHADEVEAGEDRLAERASARLGTRRIRDRIGVVPTINITVPVDDVVAALPPTDGAGPAAPPGPGWLDGYGWIDPHLAQRMLAHSPSFARVLLSKQTQVVLDVGPKRLPIHRDLRRWLQIRDGTCRFPGCNRTATACEIDHSREVRHDGRTSARNLAHLCTAHHDLKDKDWRMWQDVGGILHWLSPYGRVHTTRPAQVMAAPESRAATMYLTEPEHRDETRRHYLSDWLRFHTGDIDPDQEPDDCTF